MVIGDLLRPAQLSWRILIWTRKGFVWIDQAPFSPVENRTHPQSKRTKKTLVELDRQSPWTVGRIRKRNGGRTWLATRLGAWAGKVACALTSAIIVRSCGTREPTTATDEREKQESSGPLSSFDLGKPEKEIDSRWKNMTPKRHGFAN